MEKDVMAAIRRTGVVAVVKLKSPEDAVLLAQALFAGGILAVEITFRTEAAEESIRRIRKSCPEVLCGAGTVVSLEQARRAVSAGAEFIVCPGLSRPVIEFAKGEGIPVLPGCCTPTEIMAAMEYGLQAVKFFPAKQYGGLDTIKALAAPFPGIQFMPTGGINPENLREYLDCEMVCACGGSWMAPEGLIRERRFDEITGLAEEAVRIAGAGRAREAAG